MLNKMNKDDAKKAGFEPITKPYSMDEEDSFLNTQRDFKGVDAVIVDREIWRKSSDLMDYQARRLRNWRD